MKADAAEIGIETKQAMTVRMILSFIDISTDAMNAADDDLSFNLTVTDTGEKLYVKRKAGVLLVYDGERNGADAQISCDNMSFVEVMMGNSEAAEGISISGDKTVMKRLTAYMTPFRPVFNIIEP